VAQVKALNSSPSTTKKKKEKRKEKKKVIAALTHNNFLWGGDSILGFELRALHLLDRRSTIWVMLSPAFFFFFFFALAYFSHRVMCFSLGLNWDLDPPIYPSCVAGFGLQACTTEPSYLRELKKHLIFLMHHTRYSPMTFNIQ
jgi:hypothetical protein